MDQEKLNIMLEKSMEAARKPMWRKNLETIIYIIIFFVGLPVLSICLYYYGNYIIGTIVSIITIMGFIMGFWGKQITQNMMAKIR